MPAFHPSQKSVSTKEMIGGSITLPNATPGWRQSVSLLLMALLVAVAMAVASFTFPTLESGYLTVSLATLLLAGLALHRHSDSSDSLSVAVLVFACFFALMLAIICLFDAMDWSILGEKRDGESGLAIGLIFAFYLSIWAIRRLFPKPVERAAMLFAMILLAAAICYETMVTLPGSVIPGLNTICSCTMVLLILPGIWGLSNQISSGWRLVLNIAAVYTIINSLVGNYPSDLSGKIWIWLLWLLACIASRRGSEQQTPGIAIIERFLLGVGIYVFLLDGFSLLPGVSVDTLLVPAALLASMPLLHMLYRMNGNGSTLLCWMSLLLVWSSIGIASLTVNTLPQSSKLLIKYFLPLLIVTIALRHLWLRYRSGIRPLFISGSRGFPVISLYAIPRTVISGCAVILIAVSMMLPGWMLVTNTSPTKLLVRLHGTPLWPGLPVFITLAMHDEYYYYDKTPWRWPTSAKANVVIESLWHNPPDKFSYHKPKSLHEEIERYKTEKGKAIVAKLNFSYKKDKKSGVCRIVTILPNSPIEKADIHRGDELVAVNHKQEIPDKVCSAVGEKVLLTVRDNAGNSRDVTVACTAAAPFKPFHRVIDTKSGPVGYLYLDGFSYNEYRGVSGEIKELKKLGISKLVLDLRSNGGGLVVNEMDLDAMLLGKRFSGIGLNRQSYNHKYRDSDSIKEFPYVESALGLSKLVVLTTAETCSASEALINDLKTFLWVKTVGSKTCGKPLLMDPIHIGSIEKGTQLELVTAKISNFKGSGDYFDGIKPDCDATDDGIHDLGDPQEKLLKEALYLLEGGRCSK
ncbi:MAG: hypothetical protein HXX17_16615 [Geobacteraceae bacterium]|nr:hypothetical protein [Geobacteraceae bacterium]